MNDSDTRGSGASGFNGSSPVYFFLVCRVCSGGKVWSRVMLSNGRKLRVPTRYADDLVGKMVDIRVWGSYVED